MVKLLRVLGVNIEIVKAHGEIILSQFDVINICRFLIDVMDNNEVIYDLHLVEGVSSGYAYAQVVLECYVGIQLMNKDVSRLWT